MNNETKLSDLTVGEFREIMDDILQGSPKYKSASYMDALKQSGMTGGYNGSQLSVSLHSAWCMCLQCRYKNY